MSAAGTGCGPELSIVAPVYNELANLGPLVDELERVLGLSGRGYEIVLVDDGSVDGSAAAIAGLVAARPAVRGVYFRHNCGQTAAFDAGFKAARGRVVVTIDADRQNDPADIPRLIDALDDADVAVGFRRVRRDSWIRRVSSRVANAIRNRLSGDDIIDSGCSLRAFRRECLAGLKLYTGLHRFLPTLLRHEGYRVVQLPVNHRPRVAGTSKYGVLDRAFAAFADLLVVRWMRRRRLEYDVVERSETGIGEIPADRRGGRGRGESVRSA